MGVLLTKLLGLSKASFLETLILGCFGISIIATLWAFFFRVSWEFQILLISLICLTLLLFKETLCQFWTHSFTVYKSFSLWPKIGFIIITILIAMQCASSPYLIDNESYYIQTIKWLNRYGFVKGLVNLHVFLGQQSGWHILQSALNLEFLYARFNDLSGFTLWIANFWAFEHYTKFLKHKDSKHWFISACIVGNLFFFQFISAPSPDIPIYIISILVVFTFITAFKKISKSKFLIMCLLVLFAIYIKPTSIALCLFPLCLFLKQYKTLKTLWLSISCSVSLVFLIFALKNYIITGYPIFPSSLLSLFSPDWQLPRVMTSTFYNMVKVYGYFVSIEQYSILNTWSLFKIWVTLPKLHGFFNSLAIVLALTTPIILALKKCSAKYWVIYGVFILQMLLMFYTSPQYRFFFNLLFILNVLCVGALVNFSDRYLKVFMILGIVLPSIPLLIPIDIQQLSSNKFSEELSTFLLSNVFVPHPNSKFSTKAESKTIKNLHYNNPKQIDFFWGTGDLPLPALRTDQLNYFQEWFHYIPQQRNMHIKNGFYSEPYYP